MEKNPIKIVEIGSQGNILGGVERDSISAIRNTYTSEIVVAICGPIGTQTHVVAERITHIFSGSLGYKTDHIKLSDYIRQYGARGNDCSIAELITLGNNMREKDKAILAKKAIHKINSNRHSNAENITGHDSGAIIPEPVVKHCHVIDSIKNIDELQILRLVYGDMLHLISIYDSIERRVHAISKRDSITEAGVYGLIDKDSWEEIGHGQSVRKIYPQADLFISLNEGTISQVDSQIKRYFQLVLGMSLESPTENERAMFYAFSASGNSACLSRQVGAAITDKEGSLLAVGWNDVPKSFGGVYTQTGVDDKRCYNLTNAMCYNDENKSSVASVIINELIKSEIIEQSKKDEAINIVKRSPRFKDLIEFSRAVHAEMYALISAGKLNGSKIPEGAMHVTTYPCHHCAKHIIAAGIRKIYFIEPYQKSLATKLHSDSIVEGNDEKRVSILPFVGIAPRRFNKLFSTVLNGQTRKKDGKLHLSPDGVLPSAISLEALGTLEKLAFKSLLDDSENGG